MLRVMRLSKSELAPELQQILPEIISARPFSGLLSEAQGFIASVAIEGDDLLFYTNYTGGVSTVPCLKGVPQFVQGQAVAARNFEVRRELWLNAPAEKSPYNSFLNILLHAPQHVVIIDNRDVVLIPFFDEEGYKAAVAQETERQQSLSKAAAAAKARRLEPVMSRDTSSFRPLYFLSALCLLLLLLVTSSLYEYSPVRGWIPSLWYNLTAEGPDIRKDLHEVQHLKKLVEARLLLAEKMREHELMQTGSYLARVTKDSWDDLRRLRLERSLAQSQESMEQSFAKYEAELQRLRNELLQKQKESEEAHLLADKAQAEAEKAHLLARQAQAQALAAGEDAEAQAIAAKAAAEEARTAKAAALAAKDAAYKAEVARKAALAEANAQIVAAKRAKEQALKEAKEAQNHKKLPKCSMIRRQGTMPMLILASDGSGSMVQPMGDGNDRIDAAIDSASMLIDRVDKHVPIHFFGIQGCPVVKNYGVFGGSQHKALKHVLHQTDPRGVPMYEYIMTPLVSAMYAMGKYAKEDADTIGIIVTDGHDTCAPRGTNICDVARQIHKEKPRLKLNFVFIGDQSELRSMRCAAEVTGGQVFSPQNTADLVRSLTEAGQTLQKVCEE